jgi:hypothetical protein
MRLQPLQGANRATKNACNFHRRLARPSFLNSIATPVDTPIDWLDSGEGLSRWLAKPGLRRRMQWMS